MKIRNIAIIFTLVTVGLFIFGERYIDKNDKSVIDIVYLNDVYQEIEEEANKGNNIMAIEEKYNCNIITLDETNYQAVINEGIGKGRIILDYHNDNNEIVGKIIFEGLTDNYSKMVNALKEKLKLILLIILIFGYGFLYYLYKKVIKPFIKLQSFASNVAKGNFDIPLEIKKDNYFGSFTEGFDLLREELKNAKENEYKANISKKELVASLSHDIKTPVATIKAICEVLVIKVKDNELLKKIKIINTKAEVIEQLINNMFHATLEELRCLNVKKSEEPSSIITDMLIEINTFNKIHLINELPGCLIYADKLRLNQVIDNIINNSYKYANTDIYVTFKEEELGITIMIADKGQTVKEDEIPLLTEKYYRGENSEGKSGSGLGLFLSKLFMEGMEGELQCYYDNGFVVEIYLKKVAIKK